MAQPSAQANNVSPIPIQVHTGDRLGFTLFIALAVHALLILGVGFDFFSSRQQAPVIEVTLAQNPDSLKPEKADYMAQENQVGGGELEQKELPSVLEPVEFSAPQVQKAAEPVPEPTPPVEATQRIAQVATIKETQIKTDQQSQQQEQSQVLQEISQEISLLERSLEMASLDAKLDVREQLLTKKSRIHKVSSVSALKTTDAYYVKQWINKIHRVGRLNYPEEARRRNIYGDLRVTVALLPDGHIKDIKIIRSSGHSVLDDAAIRIVRLAEPFAPFPEEMRAEYDILEITRTWLFSKDGNTPVL